MNHSHTLLPARNALITASVAVTIALIAFLVFEPSVTRSQSMRQFTVTQQITNEIAFLVDPGNVSMVGSIAGLTGGYATGTTVTSVRTNNTTGYSMTLHFATTSSGNSMQASSSASINDYSPASPGVPDFTWVDNAPGGAAEFGYTVRASTTGEVAAAFMNNSSACNTGTTETDDRCWLNPTTSPQVIINSSSPNTSSTTTIKFKVAVPNSPNPALPSAYYVATGTLTITQNP